LYECGREICSASWHQRCRDLRGVVSEILLCRQQPPLRIEHLQERPDAGGVLRPGQSQRSLVVLDGLFQLVVAILLC
jgi:hypothetical protein